MSDRSVLMGVLRGALRAARPGGILHPNLELPRITVFDPPPKARRKVNYQPSRRRIKTDIAAEQLTLL